ncbi:MAG: LptF/LptG family permease [Alphaproteobacteria bacterium]
MLQRYLIAQSLTTFTLLTLGLSLIIWLSQLLRRVDIILGKPDALWSLLELCIYLLPQTLSYAVPISFLITCMLTIIRLGNDSELTVMSAVGFSNRKILLPFLLLGCALMVLLMFLNTVVAPNANERMYGLIFKLRDQISTNLIKTGSFDDRIPGITIFIERQQSNGTLENIFIHDRRDPKNILTLTAQQALIDAVDNRLVARLRYGAIKHHRADANPLEGLRFSSYEYVIDLTKSGEVPRQQKRSELTFFELVEAANLLQFSKPNESIRYLARAHEQITRTLYLPFYTFCVVGLLILSLHHRSSIIKPVLISSFIAIFVRVVGFQLQNNANDSELFIIFTYIWPILMTCLMALLVLVPHPQFWLKRWLS